ncbi:MAG TPA: HlyC/CorC family transporter [Roseiarcus sp.]|nr:HlyC/CorC family transporter [Roseiarcus sp.]
MTLVVAVLVIVVSLVGAAFFAGAETALTAASRARLQALETSGDRRAKLANRLIANKGRLISAMLVGGQFVTIASSAYMTSVFVRAFGKGGVLEATAIMTVLIVVFGEVLPKTIAIAYPDRVALIIAPIVAVVVTVFAPLVRAVEIFVGLLLKLFGFAAGVRDSGLSGAEELRGAVDVLHREGEVARDQRDMFGGLLELEDVPVRDVMIHRTKMRTLDADLPAAELVREALNSHYSRIPLWRDDPENIIGILHIKDLFRAYAAAGGDVSKLSPADVALDAWFIPDATSCRAQLQAFLRRKTHSALVVDEYGMVLGLITLEDILEEIVGDITDEHDVAMPGVRQQLDGSLLVDGSVTIRDLNRAMDWDLPDDEAATVAGLVIHEARTIPEARQAFVFHGFRFEVLRRQKNRLAMLRITPTEAKGKAKAAS